MNKMHRYIALLMFSCLVMAGKSQEAAYYDPNTGADGWSIGAITGMTHFYGDISENNFFNKFGTKETKLHMGLGAAKMVNSKVALRGQLFSTGLYSTDSSDFAPEDPTLRTFIDATYYSFSGDGLFYLNPLLFNKNDKTSRWQPYGVAGLGVAVWDTKQIDQGVSEETDNVGMIKENGSSVALNLGVGTDYRVYKNWNATFEANWRPVISDKVDIRQGGFISDVPFSISLGINYKFGDFGKTSSRRERSQSNERQIKEEKDVAKTQEKDYRRLPVEGPDVLDFPQTGCTVASQQYNSTSDKQQAGRQQTSGKSKATTSGRQQTGMQQQTNSYAASGSSKDMQGVVFSVQILATSKPADRQRLEQQYNIDQPIREHRSGGIYRYVVGSLRHYDEAVSYSQQLQRKGIHDAFVVVFIDGKKISMTREMKNR